MIVEQKKGNSIVPKGLTTRQIKLFLNAVIQLPAQRPLTLDGFEVYLWEKHILANVTAYFANKDGRYSEFVDICRMIKLTIRTDQIEGVMAGIYNPSITQRLNNLAEKVDTTRVEQPVFPDAKK